MSLNLKVTLRNNNVRRRPRWLAEAHRGPRLAIRSLISAGCQDFFLSFWLFRCVVIIKIENIHVFELVFSLLWSLAFINE